MTTGSVQFEFYMLASPVLVRFGSVQNVGSAGDSRL